jgi:hypothetical protein
VISRSAGVLARGLGRLAPSTRASLEGTHTVNIVAKSTLKVPGSGLNAKFVQPGEVLPPEMLQDEAELERLVAQGLVAPETPSKAAAPQGLPPTRGKWQIDPASAAGKSADELCAMVLGIDPDFDIAELAEMSEAELVRLLTSDYTPIFDLADPTSSERGRNPEKLKKARKAAGS